MVSFRRCILAMAILALFVGLASAQSVGAPLNCTANTAVPAQARAEGHSELLGDIVITCTLPALSTFVPTAGGAVQTANITVSLGQPVTSRIFSSTTGLSEALLLIDEPGATGVGGLNSLLPQTLCAANTATTGAVTGASFGGCVGTQTSLFVNAATATTGGPTTAAAICTTLGTGGCTAFGAVPNVFEGVVPPGIPNQVVFNGIPILAPSSTGSRIFRITNIRADVTGVGTSGGTTPITAFVTASSGLALQQSNPTVAYLFPGLNTANTGSRTTSGGSSGSSITGLQQCVTAGLTAGSVLRFAEGFGSAFKTRFNTGPGFASSAVGVNVPLQNVPGTIINSESGFVPSVNFAGSGNTPGLADFGTRLKATFSNVPSGISLFVSTTNINPLGNSGISINGNQNPNTQVLANVVAGGTGGGLTGGGIPSTSNAGLGFLAALVSGEAAPSGQGGFFPLVGATNNATIGTGSIQLASIPVAPDGTATATWEVLLSNPNLTEFAEFAVFYSVNSNPAANQPQTSPAGTIALSFAPTTTSVGCAGTACTTAPIPRFLPSNTPTTFISVSQCKTVLLFPFVTTQAGFDTGLAISNTSQDTFQTRATSGTCVLHFFANAATNPPDVTTPVIGPGATDNATKATHTVGLFGIVPNFTGYVIAECNFQLGHGYALVSDTGIRNWATGYLALVLPTQASARVSGNIVQGPGVAGAVEGTGH